VTLSGSPAELARAALRPGPRIPGVTSTRGAALVEVFRAALATLDELEPAEQAVIVASLVADLRARRPVAVAPRGTLGPPTERIRDPRGAP
jgi:hypothetical protein